MPNRRITIILNSNQSKRITVLIPVPREHLQPSTTATTTITTVDTSTHYSVRELILQQARNKFHNRYLDVVYRWGGDVFTDQDVLGLKEEEVLVSMGEAYIGPPKKRTRADGKVGETRVLATESFIHEEAVKQLERVAELDGLHAAIGMPDLHKGDRFPIGCAIAASGIYPALIGSDIGCGISIYPLGKQPSHITPEKLASRLKGLDEPWEGNVKEWLALYGITQETEFDAESLGTVGGGNHFAEVVTVEEMVDVEACESMGVVTGNLYLLVHTGSRGLGSSILRHYTKSDPNPYFPLGHSEFEEYLRKHDNAVLWAKANRDLVAHRMRACIFGRRNEEEDGEEEEKDEEVVKNENTEPTPASDPRVALEKILDVTHNSATPCGYEVDGEMKDLWLHRKGAAPSDRGFVPCPGSRGDFSWILQPAGSGKVNAFSLAHGAGRLHARNAPSLRKGSPSQLTTTSLGSYVVCTDPELLVQERPEAYKGVQTVVDDMESAGIAEGVCKLRPFVTFKTGAERRK